MNIGDEKEINVTFPEEYHAEELKGKPAMFKVKVNEIKEKVLPELDDDFAQDVSDFDTLAEYKDDLKKTIAERKANEAKAKKEAGEDVKAFLAEKEQEYTDKFANPYQAAQYGYIDDVIEPRNTRFRICRGLAQLATKRQSLPAKKHGCMPM